MVDLLSDLPTSTIVVPRPLEQGASDA